MEFDEGGNNFISIEFDIIIFYIFLLIIVKKRYTYIHIFIFHNLFSIFL